MGNKIKVIVKSPMEPYGHILHIDNTLKELQRIVGGRVEQVSFPDKGIVVLVNEESKFIPLPSNFRIPGDMICGVAIVCGIDDEDFGDCPLSMDAWMDLLSEWGNEVGIYAES